MPMMMNRPFHIRYVMPGSFISQFHTNRPQGNDIIISYIPASEMNRDEV